MFYDHGTSSTCYAELPPCHEVLVEVDVSATYPADTFIYTGLINMPYRSTPTQRHYFFGGFRQGGFGVMFDNQNYYDIKTKHTLGVWSLYSRDGTQTNDPATISANIYYR